MPTKRCTRRKQPGATAPRSIARKCKLIKRRLEQTRKHGNIKSIWTILLGTAFVMMGRDSRRWMLLLLNSCEIHPSHKRERRLLRRMQEKTHPRSQRHPLMSMRGGRQDDEAIPPPAGEEIASLRSQRQTRGGDCFGGCKITHPRSQRHQMKERCQSVS